MRTNAQGSSEVMIAYQDWSGLVGNHRKEENVVKSSQHVANGYSWRPETLILCGESYQYFALVTCLCSTGTRMSNLQ